MLCVCKLMCLFLILCTFQYKKKTLKHKTEKDLTKFKTIIFSITCSN